MDEDAIQEAIDAISHLVDNADYEELRVVWNAMKAAAEDQFDSVFKELMQ